MLTPSDFDSLPDEAIQEVLPDRPITSLRDIQHVYGGLYTLSTAGSSDYAAYITPDQARDLFDEPESLIVVRVDLSGDEPALDDNQPVEVTRYSEDLVTQVGHTKYEAARGIDHSVTHRSGRDNDPDKLARYAAERLTEWPNKSAVQGVAEEHTDGNILGQLAQLGEDEEVIDRVQSAVLDELGGPTTALLTVRVKIDDTGYRWPGELEVFNEAMKARKLSKLVSKNAATDSSGVATGLVSGESARTVGMSEDPLNYYLGKQMETFPGLDPDEAWRSHPLSEDGAVTVMNADTFIEECTYAAFGARIYYLPYFLGRMTPEEARVLYDLLYGVVTEGDMSPIEITYQRLGSDGMEEYGNRLRFYVAAVMQHQMSRYDVYGETLNGSLLVPIELGLEHQSVLDSWLFSPDADRNPGSSPPLPSHDSWDLIGNGDFDALVPRGGYFYQTLPDAAGDTDASVDDLRIQALIASLGGQPVTVEALLQGYVERLLDESGDRFPSFLLASQFAQLQAMIQTDGVLTASTPAGESIIASPEESESMSDETTAVPDGGAFVQNRHNKIEQFIEETPALRDHSQRRGAFLLGALVGAVGSYQQYRQGRSTTLIDQYPVGSVTEKRVKKITQEAIAKTLTYTREENRSSTLFEWFVDRLRDTILQPDPDEWSLQTDDLRFYYALGVTYGMNDHGTSEETE